ncbi:hypothetical protein TDB9533_04501 [Thalassocella blandensis]|nr:hypothetical protein TDB9533_04501 [Thalassocella blandensis]
MPLLFSFVVILLGALLVHFMQQDSGYVLVNLGNFTIVTSFWFALVSIILATFLAIYIYRTLFSVIAKGKAFSFRRNEKKSQAGLLHYVEGDLLTAKKELSAVKQAKDQQVGEKSYVHSLMAARSALDLGLVDESEALLDQAEKSAAKSGEKNTTALAVNRTRVLMAKKEMAQARALLDGLTAKEKKHPAVVDLYRQIYIHQHDWPALINLLPQVKLLPLQGEQQYSVLEENTYMSYLNALVLQHSIAEPKTAEALEKLQSAWKSLPKTAQLNSRIVGLYCTLLARLGEDDRAEVLLRKSLKNEWHAGVVELYGRLATSDYKLQLSYAERWLEQHPDDPHLLFCLGRLSVKNELWGKAKDYFEKSLRLEPRPEVYAELATLMAKLGDAEKSQVFYRRGLELAVAKN